MEEKYLQDISEIKNMMQKSTQFLSLSGLAGIMAGIYALIGAGFAKHFLDEFDTIHTESAVTYNSTAIYSKEIFVFTIIAFIVLNLSILTAVVFTLKKSKKTNQSVWNATSKRVLFHFLIPLFAGGIFCLLLIKNNYLGLVAPSTLLFYGMACLNASKYTFRDVRYLGLTIIFLGLLAANFIGYGLLFWALGFGVCHILYGSLMYFKYDRN
jgi:hypothetical protein